MLKKTFFVLFALAACTRPSLIDASATPHPSCQEIEERLAPSFAVYRPDEVPSGLIDRSKAEEIARAHPSTVDVYCIMLGAEDVAPERPLYLVVVDFDHETMLHGPPCDDPPCPARTVKVTWGAYVDAKTGEVYAEGSL